MTLNQPPQHNFQTGVRQIIIDKNGVSRAVYTNPYSKQEDHQNYEREKMGGQKIGGEALPEDVMPQSGFTDLVGASPQRGAAGVENASPGSPPAAQAAKVQEISPYWMQTFQQKYSADTPMHVGLDPQSPVVTPEMLAPTPEELSRMSPDMRAGVARVFLALATKYYGDHTLQKTVMDGTKIRGFVPIQLMQYYRKLSGEGIL